MLLLEECEIIFKLESNDFFLKDLGEDKLCDEVFIVSLVVGNVTYVLGLLKTLFMDFVSKPILLSTFSFSGIVEQYPPNVG
jgi:hypothetical protein